MANSSPSTLPPHLPQCNPRSRNFPIAWRESYFRRHFNKERGGYVCPGCDKVFAGTVAFRQLDGKHIVPRSKGGLTVWENMTLRCKPCNMRKSNKMETQVAEKK